MQLFQQKNQTDLEDIAALLEGEIAGTGQLQGYHWMHQQVIQRGFIVSQQTDNEDSGSRKLIQLS